MEGKEGRFVGRGEGRDKVREQQLLMQLWRQKQQLLAAYCGCSAQPTSHSAISPKAHCMRGKGKWRRQHARWPDVTESREQSSFLVPRFQQQVDRRRERACRRVL
jgi:hypothetical protein